MEKIVDTVLLALVALALIVGGIFAVILVINALDGQPPDRAAPGSDSWQRVRAAGKMVVGTAADYPPFEYMTAKKRIDGFDIALMDAIGQRLGIAIEYRNYPFDQLGDRLAKGEIDAAIAAISVSPERTAHMDFSQAYYVTQDAVLAYFTTPVTIHRLADLADYRVGVQKGTVYESRLRRDLVGSGLTAGENLRVYAEIAGAVTALTRGEIDFVILDRPPAQVLDQQVGLKIAGQGLNQQSLAVALPKGSSSLQAQIDGAISQLRGEGTIARLARQYLAADLQSPTATLTPGPAVPDTPLPPVPQTTTPRPAASATPTTSATPVASATPTITATATLTATATPEPDNPLAGTQWLVTAYYNPNNLGGMASVLSGTSLAVAFTTDGQVSGSAGCNNYSASYLVDGSLLAISQIWSGKTVCDTPEGIMEQETAFLAALGSAASYAIDGNQLNILNVGGQLVVILNSP
jgi:polar amino acid transport system substrate-binding protein